MTYTVACPTRTCTGRVVFGYSDGVVLTDKKGQRHRLDPFPVEGSCGRCGLLYELTSDKTVHPVLPEPAYDVEEW